MPDRAGAVQAVPWTAASPVWHHTAGMLLALFQRGERNRGNSLCECCVTAWGRDDSSTVAHKHTDSYSHTSYIGGRHSTANTNTSSDSASHSNAVSNHSQCHSQLESQAASRVTDQMGTPP